MFSLPTFSSGSNTKSAAAVCGCLGLDRSAGFGNPTRHKSWMVGTDSDIAILCPETLKYDIYKTPITVAKDWLSGNRTVPRQKRDD